MSILLLFKHHLTKTSGTIEAWNFILKKIDHPQKHIRPDVFIQQHCDIIVARQRQFFDDLQEPFRKKIKVLHIHLHVHSFDFVIPF